MATGVSKLATGLQEHDYNLTALKEACDEEDIEAMESEITKNLHEHTPLPSPNPKKTKARDKSKQSGETTNADILNAIQALIKRFDEQDVRLKTFEKRIEANSRAVNENKEEISKMKVEIENLKRENGLLNQSNLDLDRYKRRWNLRLNGLKEKENEDTREVVIGILTRVLPVSVEKLRIAVDTVHRLGRKNDVASASNNRPRQIIVQFTLRTVRDEVWRKSREATVCKDMHIQFKEDFSKEDREARAKLWPTVLEARRNGKRAFLKEGYALIDGHRIEL